MRYPLGEQERESVRSHTGKPLSAFTLENVLSGAITAEDIKISGETLKKQGEIATDAGNWQLADNFTRAAELVNVPDDVMLAMYNQLRPHRSTKAELTALRDNLLTRYNAPTCAALVSEAIEVYEARGLLAGTDR